MDQLLRCSSLAALVKNMMVVMEEKGLRRIVEGSVVVVVGRRGCCMNYVAKKLLQELRANPTMCEISEGFAKKMTVMDKIAKILSGDDRTLVPQTFPLVFI
ncbi:putative glutaredoxin-like, plant II, Thioredoxin-like superfamily [Dioscorea sansibarensis]